MASVWDEDLYQQRLAEKEQTQQPRNRAVFSQEYAPKEEESDQSSIPGLDVAKRGVGTLLTQLAGAPGDIESSTRAMLHKGKEAFQDIVAPDMPKTEPAKSWFPTSTEVRQKYKELYGTDLEPKNKAEADFQSSLRDLTMNALGMNPIRAFGTTAMGYLAGEAADKLHMSEDAKNKAKSGAMMLASLWRPGTARNVETNAWNAERALRPQNANVNMQFINPRLADLNRDMRRGGTRGLEHKTAALDSIAELQAAAQSGRIGLEELLQHRRAINHRISDAYNKFGGNKEGMAEYRRNLNRVQEIVDDAIDSYGRTNQPWLNAFREANQVTGAIRGSEQFARFMEYNRDALIKGGLPSALLLSGTGGLAATAYAAATGASLYQAWKLVHQMRRSPALARAYGRVIRDAAAENIPQASKNLHIMGKEMEKMED